ncbi:MAG: 2-hydroxycarboxylate transporter family protein, partial [Clostridiales bacterium]|nr:2-hydroxycarboxylate transporter family protein [Clostridiales bacterium]
MSETKGKKTLWQELNDLGGMPIWLYAVCSIIIIAVVAAGALGSDITAFIAVCCVISILFYKIGKVLPIWNTYIGGGLLMIFFGTAVLKQFNLIPEQYVELIGDMVQGDV